MKSFRFVPLLVGLALMLSGCGGRENSASPMSEDVSASSGAASNALASSEEAAPSAKTSATGANVQAIADTSRKIIYNATVSLVVPELDAAQDKLTKLVKANAGYIAETNVGGASGSQRSGTWKVRVPVEHYEAFMAGAARLGELQTIQANSQDVTAEFYDVQAHIANKQVEEKRLQRLLETATGKLTEVLQVERELSRVRGEIEALQGRIRVLSNLSSLTTVTLTLNEIKNYVPPAPPTFGNEIARQFGSSLHALGETGKGLVLLFVGLAPWLLVLGVLGFPLWRVLRRARASKTD